MPLSYVFVVLLLVRTAGEVVKGARTAVVVVVEFETAGALLLMEPGGELVELDVELPVGAE